MPRLGFNSIFELVVLPTFHSSEGLEAVCCWCREGPESIILTPEGYDLYQQWRNGKNFGSL